MLDLALQELDVRETGLALVFACECEHLVGHVEAVSLAGWTDAFCGEEDIDASAGAEIEDGFSGMEVDERGRIAAAEGCEHGVLGEASLVRLWCRGFC